MGVKGHAAARAGQGPIEPLLAARAGNLRQLVAPFGIPGQKIGADEKPEQGG
jgi:hypothetical protein